jgi:predicted MFS family arabinose efflux permease
MEGTVSERGAVAYLAFVQFVSVLSLAIVMPLGPDFAAALHMPLSSLGVVVAAYTLAAMCSGLLCAPRLDAFDRRSALAICLVGLSVSHLAAAGAEGPASLIAARVVAGLFGGPATALLMAIVGDLVPEERRGRALGIIMTAFSVATVLGVPTGLRLSHVLGWRAPFLAVAALALSCAIAGWWALPPLSGHLSIAGDASGKVTPRAAFGRTPTLLAYASTGMSMLGMMLMVPNLSGYVQANLGFPRERLEVLYAVSGLLNLVSLRLIGRAVDRFGALRVSALGSGLSALVAWEGYVRAELRLPIVVVFSGFMFAAALRNVSVTTLASKVPAPEARGRFMGLQTAIQHGSTSLGALLSSLILDVGSDGRLVHMDRVALLSIALFLAVPACVAKLQRALERGVGAAALVTAP